MSGHWHDTNADLGYGKCFFRFMVHNSDSNEMYILNYKRIILYYYPSISIFFIYFIINLNCSIKK